MASMTAGQLRAIALAEWRGLPEYPLTPAPAKPVGDLVTQFMAKLGLSERLREEEILRAWRDIVGDFVAAHSTPHRLQAGVLTVRVLQPTILYELDRVFKKRLLEKLQDRFGKTIRDLKFRFG
jgi:predicted nucleic acid-binding Zn ribbon protein